MARARKPSARRGSTTPHGSSNPRARDRPGSLASLSSRRATIGRGDGKAWICAQGRAPQWEAHAHLSEKGHTGRRCTFLNVTDVTDRLRIGAAIRNAGNSYSHKGFFFLLRMLRMNSIKTEKFLKGTYLGVVSTKKQNNRKVSVTSVTHRRKGGLLACGSSEKTVTDVRS